MIQESTIPESSPEMFFKVSGWRSTGSELTATNQDSPLPSAYTVCQLSGPAARQDHHPVPKARHPAAHDALAPIQGPTPNVRQHTLRATTSTSPATESEGTEDTGYLPN